MYRISLEGKPTPPKVFWRTNKFARNFWRTLRGCDLPRKNCGLLHTQFANILYKIDTSIHPRSELAAAIEATVRATCSFVLQRARSASASGSREGVT